ncbi:MAG: hypothetical protein ACKVYV_09245 [Limisphaerales bacterium]
MSLIAKAATHAVNPGLSPGPALLLGVASRAPALAGLRHSPPAPRPEIPEDGFYRGEHRVTFCFFSSPWGINWASPRTLFLSALFNYFHPRDRKISHVAVEVQGPRRFEDAEAPFYSFASMSDRGKEVVQKLLVDQIGLGMVLSDYPGTLETAGVLQQEMRRKVRSGRVHRVSYLISEESAFRLQLYLKEYPEKGNDRIYGGLASHPRYLEGAGCVAYARAISEIVGLDLDATQSRWLRTVRVSRALVGDPQQNRRVSVLKLVWGQLARRWATPSEPHVELSFYDPDHIFRQVAAVAQAATGRKRLPARLSHFSGMSDLVVRRLHRSFELLFDRRDSATPTEPLWLSRPPAFPS